MEKIISYLRSHLSEHRRVSFWLTFILYLIVAIFFRYNLGFEPSYKNLDFSLIFGFAFYAFPYFFTVFLYAYFHKKNDIWQKGDFWLLSILILAVLFLNQYIHFYEFFTKDLHTFPAYFYNSVFFNLQSTLFYLFIPFLYWRVWKDKERQESFYGFTKAGFQARPYVLMLLLMLPLLVWASFQADFLNSYPRYKPYYAESYWNISPIPTVSIYETSYVLQFIGLEVFFRGFLVFTLARYLGSGSVFVMVAVYVHLHFFKPMPETIGSAFGGYILGVIAYYSRSVWGGMFVHISIALLMEFLAFLQIYLRS